MGIELFGVVAIAVMIGAYALEGRGRAYVLVFAIGCGAAATYAVLIHSWPFAIAEALWCGIALRRWWKTQADTPV